jgi:hypothetical protein
LATCSMAMTAAHALPRHESSGPKKILASVSAALPGLLLAAYAGPWPGIAVSVLVTVSAVYLRLRRPL